jgi:AAA+ ATPase superfamily predicted ATPase
VDSIIGKATGAYFANLEKEYALIQRSRPLFSKPAGRNIRWRIGDHYLNFWFRFIYANQMLVELQRFDLLHERILQDYTQYSGMALEDYFRSKLMETERYTTIGKYWDRKGVNEIDIIALDDIDGKALVAEVKRKPNKIDLSVLQAKAFSLSNELSKYAVSFQALSMNDM